MLPSAALMPPWAATVWERVGNSLVMHLGGGEVGGVSYRATEVPCLLLTGQPSQVW